MRCQGYWISPIETYAKRKSHSCRELLASGGKLLKSWPRDTLQGRVTTYEIFTRGWIIIKFGKEITYPDFNGDCSLHISVYKFFLMIFCVPEIFILVDIPSQLSQLNTFHFKPTFSRELIIVLLWSPFLGPLFLLVIIPIWACLCLQQKYEEPNQDATH